MSTFRANRYNGEWCAKCGDKPRAPSHAYCRVCRNEYTNENKRYRYATQADYRRKAKAHQRKMRYGIDEDRYTEMWAQQGGVCAICLCDPENSRGGLHVDHNHSTDEVRGLLCGSCNKAIGLLYDRQHLMERAAQYVS